MKSKVSRIVDWGGTAEAPRIPTPAAPALPMSPSRERAAMSEGRARAAMTAATTIWSTVNKRLVYNRKLERFAALAMAMIGIAGIAGLTFIIHTLETARMTVVVSGIAAVAACVPLFPCVMRVARRVDKDALNVTAMEGCRVLIAQAKRLGETIIASSDHDGLSAAKHQLLDMLLNDLEKASSAANQRSGVLRGESTGEIRRQVRICPRNRRVLVTTGDDSRFNVNIIDVSMSGVAVEGALSGAGVGSDVVVGSRKARVVRVLPRGVAFEFSTPIPAEQFGLDIVL